MKALITGITGQDGSYLAEYLLSAGYEVFGIIRRNSAYDYQPRIAHLVNDISLRYGDVTDASSLLDTIKSVKPDEVYNLAAQSHVKISSDVPLLTAEVNAIGALNVLDICRQVCPQVRFYQASTSEMFGNNMEPDRKQRESTPMSPVSPYGCSKLFAHSMVKHYRRAYGMYAVSGILFNHESPRRGADFVTSKIVRNALLIKSDRTKKLELGNLDSQRDWGHAKDYVKAMHLMLNQDTPKDFVIATGETHSVRDLCEYVFCKLDLDYREHVVQNPLYMRPDELDYLCGDASKAQLELGWEREYNYYTMIDEMIEYWSSVKIQ